MSGRLAQACRRTLQAWSAPDFEQERLRRLYLEHLQSRPDGWSRNCPGAHLTASSLICAPEVGAAEDGALEDGAVAERAVLLTLHARLGRWLQTGGHIEPGDAGLESAALREAEEESGLADLTLDPRPLLLSRHEVPCGPVSPCYHLDVQFLITSPTTTTPTFGAESTDVAWFAVGALPPTDQSVRDLVAAATERLSLELDRDAVVMSAADAPHDDR